MIHVYAIHLPAINHDSIGNSQSVERLFPLLTDTTNNGNTEPCPPLPGSESLCVNCTVEWEVARIRRFRQPADQLRALLGTLLLRTAVQQGTGSWPKVFRTHFGKPELRVQSPDGQDCSIPASISHIGPWVVACVASRQEVGRVGIDVTSLDAAQCLGASDAVAMYSPLLAIREREWITSAHTDLEALRRFASCWTIKEAVLKCLGSGLTGTLEPLKTIELAQKALPDRIGEWQVVELLDQGRLSNLPIPKELCPCQPLHVSTTQLDQEHMLSLAVEPVAADVIPVQPHVTVLTVDQLIDMISHA